VVPKIRSPAPRGTVSSRDAAGTPARELQLRVSISAQ